VRDTGVKVQVAYAAEKYFGTRHYYRAPGGDPEDDKARERMTQTLSVAYVQVRYNAVFASVFENVDAS